MSAPSGKPYTILLVDDNIGLLDNMRVCLELRGYRVMTATDGIEGLERVVESKPDCVVLDVKMAQMNGHQLARALRGDQETAAMPIVMLSALQQEKEVFAGQASGADYYLVKPVGMRELVETIHQAIATSQEQRGQRLRDLAQQSANLPQNEDWPWVASEGPALPPSSEQGGPFGFGAKRPSW